MKALKTLLPAAALAAALAASAAPVQAAVFAQFTPDHPSADYKWINSGGPSNTGTGGHLISIVSTGATAAQGVSTHFQFLDATNSALGFIPATFKLDATVASGNPASTNGAGVVNQQQVGGTFSFVYSGVTTVNFNGSGITLTHGENLLSAVFTDAWIQGAGGSGSFNLAHINGGTATYSSALVDFSHTTKASEEFAFNLLSVTPNFTHKAGDADSSFRANGGGNFSAGGVPEPATWALMIMGFGGLGVTLRNRRRLATASA
jgi:hypothetical protein